MSKKASGKISRKAARKHNYFVIPRWIIKHKEGTAEEKIECLVLGMSVGKQTQVHPAQLEILRAWEEEAQWTLEAALNDFMEFQKDYDSIRSVSV